MAEYVNPRIEVDASEVEAAVYEYLQIYYPGWEPRTTGLVSILTEAFAEEIAELTELASDVPPAIFRYFGRLVGIYPGEETYATASVTFEIRDHAQHTIREGTNVRVRIADDEWAAFATSGDIEIAASDPLDPLPTVTVQVVAEIAGSEASGLDGEIELMDILDFISSVTLNGSTINGTDAEAEDVFMDRLATRLQLLADRPILPRDFEVYATTVGGVAWAFAIDNYNPADDTYDNERMITLVSGNADGTASSTAKKNETKALLEAAREVNFTVNTMDPTYNIINVEVEVKALPGVDLIVVEEMVMDYLNSYFASESWGVIAEDGIRRIETKVYWKEIIALVSNVPGVDRVTAGPVMGIYAEAQAEDDITLNGVVPLTQPGVFTVNVVA